MLRQVDRSAENTHQSRQDSQAEAMGEAQGDNVGPVPIEGEEVTLQRFSLKFEEMMSGKADPLRGLRASYRRARQQMLDSQRTPLQKTYSQYNLTQLSTAVEDESHHKALHGIYGLLARHIEVPPHVVEDLQPHGPWSRHRRPSIFGLPVLHPYASLGVAWRTAMLLFDLTFTAFWVPLDVGFCFTSYGDLSKPCTQSDLAGGVVYSINWLMGFLIGVVAVATPGTRRLVVLDGRSVAKLYIRYGKFVIDTLSVLPFIVLIVAITSPHEAPVSPEHRLWSLLSLVRLVRLVRLFNTVKVVYKDSLNGSYKVSWVAQRISVPLMFLLILGYQLLVVINLCASLMILLATYYGGPDGITWFNSMKWVDFASASPPLTWMHAAYWIVTVLTTTGQGQAPRQVGEMIVSNFCSVYGMVFNGLVVGVLGDALMRASGDASALLRSRRNVARASEWAALRHLRPSLVKDLQVYFADSELAHRQADLARRDFNKEASYIDDLPTSLRRSVLQHIVAPLLEKVHVLSKADPELRRLLASMFRPVDVPPNHDLCRQGTTADRLWVVEWGNVVALRHKEAEAHPTTGMTSLLGETVLLRGVMEPAATRPWTLRTTSRCRLWELHWADLEKMLRVGPTLVATMLQYVKERLIYKLDGIPERDYNWCELVVVLGRILKQPAMLDSARDNLEALVQARVDDGSLPMLLSSWLEAGIATSLELGLGATLDRKRGLVTMSLMLARQSNDAGPNPGINPYGSSFHYTLASPSPAIMSRYGSVRVAGGGGLPRGGLSAGGSGFGFGSGGGGGGGAPGSPQAGTIVPAASPALLMRQHSGGRAVPGAEEVVDLASRSPAVSGELPPTWYTAGEGSEGGGAGAAAAASSPMFSKRSRSFNDRYGGGGAAGAASGGGDGGSEVKGQPSAEQTHLSAPGMARPRGSGSGATGSAGPAAGGGGRGMPSLSRFALRAALGTVRRPPMSTEDGLPSAAPASGHGSRRASGRVSMSDDGMMAAARGGGGDGDGPDSRLSGGGRRWDTLASVTSLWAPAAAAAAGAAAGAAAAAAADGGSSGGEVRGPTIGDGGSDPDPEVAPRRWSVIAHTPMAYRVVDAGGSPAEHPPGATTAAAAAERDPTAPPLPQAQQLSASSQSSRAAGPRAAGAPGVAPASMLVTATSAPGPAPPGVGASDAILRAGQRGAIASAFEGGRGGAGSPGAASPSGGSPRAGSRSGGGGGPFDTGSPTLTSRSARNTLIRTRSAQMLLPQVPEEDRPEGQRSSRETERVNGGSTAPRDASGAAGTAAAAGEVAAVAAAVAADGRLSPPAAASALALFRRRGSATVGGVVAVGGGASGPPAAAWGAGHGSGGGGGNVSGGDDGRVPQRHRMVARSRSAVSLGFGSGHGPSVLTGEPTSASPQPPQPPLPPLPRVREEGTASGHGSGSGSGSSESASASAAFTAAAAVAAQRRRRTSLLAATEQTPGTGAGPVEGGAAMSTAAAAAVETYNHSSQPQLQLRLATAADATAASGGGDPPSSSAATGQPPAAPLAAAGSSLSSTGGGGGGLLPNISSVSPAAAQGFSSQLGPAIVGAPGAAPPAGLETKGPTISERLLQLPQLLPDRVSRLRPARAQSPLPSWAVGRPLSVGNLDTAGGSGGGGGGAAGSVAAGSEACPALTICQTCGRCTCAECRARARTAALAVEQGAATLAPRGPAGAAAALAALRPPAAWGPAAAPAAAGYGGSPAQGAPLELARATATTGPGATYGTGYGMGPAAAGAPWALGHVRGAGAGGNGGGRGPETWRRRRVSMAYDLSAPSMAAF